MKFEERRKIDKERKHKKGEEKTERHRKRNA